jgi:hypothetical protein
MIEVDAGYLKLWRGNCNALALGELRSLSIYMRDESSRPGSASRQDAISVLKIDPIYLCASASQVTTAKLGYQTQIIIPYWEDVARVGGHANVTGGCV